MVAIDSYPRFLSQPDWQWQRKFISIISYLEESNTLEELYCLLRKKHGLTHTDVGAIVNSCRQTIGRYEGNKRDLRFSEILALSEYHEDFRLAAIAYLEKNKKQTGA